MENLFEKYRCRKGCKFYNNFNGVNMKKICILGTEYEIIETDEETENRLKKVWGFCDFNTKQIYINNDVTKETEDSCKNLQYFRKKVIRHEILHAFLYESGLKENSEDVRAWAEHEEMVDWFAIQIPKIVEVYKQLNILN